VVLGGLIKDDVQESEQRVPLLGSIPLLGKLFRSTSVSYTKSNLLIFLRPTIIREPGELQGATAEKYRYIRDQQQKKREQGVIYLDEEVLPLLPEWEEQLKALDDMKTNNRERAQP